METADNLMERMEGNLLCAICHDYFKQAVTLNCTHSFCYTCIINWRKTRNECPVCRLHINSITSSLALDNLVSAYTNQEKVKTQIIVEDNINRSNGWSSKGEGSYNNGNRDPMDTEDFEGELEEEEEEESDFECTESEDEIDGDIEEETSLDVTENSDFESVNISSEGAEEEEISISFGSFSFSCSIESSNSSSSSNNSDFFQMHLSYDYFPENESLFDDQENDYDDGEDDEGYDVGAVTDESM